MYGLLGLVVVCGTVYLATPEILTEKQSDIGAVSVSYEDPDDLYFSEFGKVETLPEGLVLASTLTNIDYLAYGYNIYKGNPNTPTRKDSNLIDPGFSDNKVYLFTNEKHLLSDDKNYEVPDYLAVKQEKACQLKFESETITGE